MQAPRPFLGGGKDRAGPKARPIKVCPPILRWLATSSELVMIFNSLPPLPGRPQTFCVECKWRTLYVPRITPTDRISGCVFRSKTEAGGQSPLGLTADSFWSGAPHRRRAGPFSHSPFPLFLGPLFSPLWLSFLAFPFFRIVAYVRGQEITRSTIEKLFEIRTCCIRTYRSMLYRDACKNTISSYLRMHSSRLGLDREPKKKESCSIKIRVFKSNRSGFLLYFPFFYPLLHLAVPLLPRRRHSTERASQDLALIGSMF